MSEPKPLYMKCQHRRESDATMACIRPAYGWAGVDTIYPERTYPACKDHMEEGNYD